MNCLNGGYVLHARGIYPSLGSFLRKIAWSFPNCYHLTPPVTCVGDDCYCNKKMKEKKERVSMVEKEFASYLQLKFVLLSKKKMRNKKSHSPFVTTTVTEMFWSSVSPISRSWSFAVFSTAMVIFTAIIATFDFKIFDFLCLREFKKRWIDWID